MLAETPRRALEAEARGVLLLAACAFLALPLVDGPARAHHGPKWVDAQAEVLPQLVADADADGILDPREERIGTDPGEPDGDDDGFDDFETYYAGFDPARRYQGPLGEIIGTAYSSRMERALLRMRAGEGFPPELAVELPCPAVTRRLYGEERPGRPRALGGADGVSPSAATIQSGVAASGAIPYVSALYPTYDQIVAELVQIASAALVSMTLGLAPAAGAAILYDFSWSGSSFSATGSLELDDSVAVGSSFDVDDVIRFDVEFFEGSQSVETASFPPYPGFGTFHGRRNESSLGITDLIVGNDDVTFGCTGSFCSTGEVFFNTDATPGEVVVFDSEEAALDAFVFVEAPEPGAAASLAVALAVLAGLRLLRPPTRPLP